MSGAKTAGAAAAAVVLVPVAAVMAITMLVTAVASTGGVGTLQIEAASCTAADDGADYAAGSIPNGWGPLVQAAAEEAGIPVSIAAAQLQQESNWDEKAVSHAGAMGLAQFMPRTWRLYGNRGDPFTAADAIPAYGRYMAALRYEADFLAAGNPDVVVRLMLAAYNAGPAAIKQHQGIPPFQETEQYVASIVATGQSIYSPECEIPGGGGEWDGDLGDGQWTNPLPGGTLTSGYGHRNVPGLPDWAQNHVGVDLATGSGTGAGGPVIAPTRLRITGFNDPDGCVIAKEAGDDPDFGFAFCHLNAYNVSVGQVLQRGDIIGTEGNRAQLGQVGTHLHFEIYKPEAPAVAYPYQGWNLDPEPILKEKGAWP